MTNLPDPIGESVFGFHSERTQDVERAWDVFERAHEKQSVSDGFWHREFRGRSWWPRRWPACALANCALCRKLMAKRRLIQACLPRLHRHDLPPLLYVCIGCHSKIRALWRRHSELHVLQRATRSLQEAIRDVRKDQKHRSAEGLPA